MLSTNNSKPTLLIEAEDFTYIRESVMKANFREVGGLGIVVLEDGKPVVRHMRLLHQSISSGEVEWADDAHSEYLTWLYTPEENGGVGFEGDSYGLYSWHSHGNMSTFYSGTDEDFIRRVGLTVPYVFSSVFNNKMDCTNRLDVFTKIECDMLVGDHPRQITYGNDNVVLEVIPHPDAAPIYDEMLDLEISKETALGELKKEYDATVKKISDEANDSIKPLQLAMKEIYKRVRADISKEVDADFKVYVKNSSYGFSRGTTGKGSTPSTKTTTHSPTNSNQNGSGKQGQTGTTTAGGKGKESNGTGTRVQGAIGPGGGASSGSPYVKIFRGYDTTAKKSSFFTIRDIIDDEDIALIEVIPATLISQLTEDEKAKLTSRQTYEEWMASVLKVVQEEGASTQK